MSRKDSGVTLVELLIVMAVMAVLSGIVGVNYFGVRSRIAFENQLSEISADLGFARSRSIAQESGGQWGIHFSNPDGDGNDFYEIWYGDSYDAGVVVERTNLHGSVAFSDPSSGTAKDIVFLKTTGAPEAASTLGFYSLNSSSTGIIEVNSEGRVDVTYN